MWGKRTIDESRLFPLPESSMNRVLVETVPQMLHALRQLLSARATWSQKSQPRRLEYRLSGAALASQSTKLFGLGGSMGPAVKTQT